MSAITNTDPRLCDCGKGDFCPLWDSWDGPGKTERDDRFATATLSSVTTGDWRRTNDFGHQTTEVTGNVTHSEVVVLVYPDGSDTNEVRVWVDQTKEINVDLWTDDEASRGCVSIGAPGAVEDVEVWGSASHLRQIGLAMVELAARMDARRG